MSKKLTPRELEIAEGINTLVVANMKFLAGWQHFLTCINFDMTALDAEAILFMNEAPYHIREALQNLARLKLEIPKEVPE